MGTARTNAALACTLLACAAFLAPPARAQDPVPEVPRPVPQAPDQQPTVPEAPPPDDKTKPPPVEQAPKALPIVMSMRVEGQRRYTSNQLLSPLGQKVGSPYDPGAAEKGLDTIWNALNVRGMVLTRPVEGGIDVLLRVEEMVSDLEPRFVGNKEIKTERLRQWALLEDKGELFLYQADRVRHRLLEGYHKEGYAFAEVDVVKRGSESTAVEAKELPDVIFEIREGPQVRVKDVVVHGSVTMPDTGMWWWKDGLKKLAKTELGGPWLFNWFGDKYVRETLDADILAMREVYRDRGYLDAVVELDHLAFSEDHEGVVIHIVVDEGKPYTVSGLHITGIKRTPNPKTGEPEDSPEPLLFTEAELLALCKLEPGKQYERTVQNSDANALRDWYGDRGYLSHPSLITDYFEFVEPRLTFDPEKHTVDVTYRLAQGRKRTIREVIFSGARHTRDRVLRRQVDVLPGQVANLSEIRKGLQHIYSTGYFTDETATVEHHDPTFSFKPTGDPGTADLEYNVEEGKVVTIQLQGGVSSDSGLFGRIQLQMRNFDIADPPSSFWSTFGELFDKEAFHGGGQEFEIELMPGTEVNAYRIRFLEPDIFRTHFNPWSLEGQLNRTKRSEHFYDEDRKEARIRFGHQFSRNLSAYVGYTTQALDVTNLDSPLTGLNDPVVPPLPDSIYQQAGETTLQGMTFDLQRRDLDQFLNPRSGSQWAWRNALYGDVLGGDYQFFKSSIDTDWFWLVGDETQDVRPGFHVGLGGGVSDVYGDTDLVPYTERFFLGGAKTLRGFERRGVGPNRGDNTLGGATYMAGTLEYHYPLHSITQPGSYKQVETFRLLLFTDAGVLGPDPWKLDPSEVRWTYGFGLGMVHPFPISLNFGFPIRSFEGDREEVFSFTILSLWF